MIQEIIYKAAPHPPTPSFSGFWWFDATTTYNRGSEVPFVAPTTYNRGSEVPFDATTSYNPRLDPSRGG